MPRGVHDNFAAAQREETRNGGQDGDGEKDDQPAGQDGSCFFVRLAPLHF
jgi:hypothetical protein